MVAIERVVSAPPAHVTGDARRHLTAAPSQRELAEARGQLADWAQLGRYRAANAALPAPARGEKRVVFFGDSITDMWPGDADGFFRRNGYIGRGISGQTTSQMVVRFQQDVVALKPRVVVVLAGTNDIAGNTGPISPAGIEANFMTMLAAARANGITMVIASILPADHYDWRPGQKPASEIRAMNDRLRALCAREGLVYLDYHSAMTNAGGGLDTRLAADGVHPTREGYAVMAPLAERAVARALSQKR